MAELDEYAATLAEVAREAREAPEVVRTAPHNQTVHHTHHDDLDDPERWAITWRSYQRKYATQLAAPRQAEGPGGA
jgi:glycine dehydrogenase subunit 2